MLFLIALALSLGGCQSQDEIVVSGNSGSFVSPNYPKFYGRNEHVLYRAKLSTPGPQQVSLDTRDAQIPYFWGRGCPDHISIPELQLNACPQPKTIYYFTLQGNEFNMTFVSGSWWTSATRRFKFNITYTVLEGDCKATVNIQSPLWTLMPITDMVTRNSLVFNMHTCGRYKLCLSPSPSDTCVSMYTQVFVLPNVATPYLRYCNNLCRYEYFNVTNVDCCSFWLHWNSTTLTLGQGTVVGSNLIMYDESSSMDYHFIYIRRIEQNPLVIEFDAPLPYSYCTPSPSTPPVPSQCTSTTSTTPSVESSQTMDQTNSFDYTVTTDEFHDVASTIFPSIQSDTDSSNDGDNSVVTGTFDNSISDTLYEVGSTPWSFSVASASGAGEAVVTSPIHDTNVITASTSVDAVTTSTSHDPPASLHNQNTTPEPDPKAPASPKEIKYSRQQRPCKCIKLVPSSAVNTDQERKELDEKKAEVAKAITKNLTMAKTNVSSTVRRKASAGDTRQSSAYIGLAMAVVCFSPLALIVLGDCLTLVAWVRAVIIRKWHMRTSRRGDGTAVSPQ